MSALIPIHKLAEQLRDADRCDACGGTRVVLNIAYRGFKAERVTSETHCMCPDSPLAKYNGPVYIEPVEPPAEMVTSLNVSPALRSA